MDKKGYAPHFGVKLLYIRLRAACRQTNLGVLLASYYVGTKVRVY